MRASPNMPLLLLAYMFGIHVCYSYARDEGVLDSTGVHQNPWDARVDQSRFEKDLHTPTQTTCLEWDAWGSLNAAAPAVSAASQTLTTPFVYDLVNCAREVGTRYLFTHATTIIRLNLPACLSAYLPTYLPTYQPIRCSHSSPRRPFSTSPPP